MTNGNGLPAYSGANRYLANGLTSGAYTESGGNAADETIFGGPDTCEGGWSQIALTFDAGASNVWVNGLPQFTQVAYSDIGWGAQPFAVANDPNNPTRNFVGDLDETQVYDVPLTSIDLEYLRMEALCANVCASPFDVWPDLDQDGYGDVGSVPTQVCAVGPYQSEQAGDCDDGDFDINPDAIEQCDSGIDEDCDPTTNCDDSCLSEIDFSMCDTLVPGPAPFLHWSYDNVTASQVLDDAGSAYDGTFFGAPTFNAGVVGNAAHFDGASWMESATALPLPGDTWTYVTWMRVNSASDNLGAFHFLMTNGNGLPGYSGANMYLANGLTSGAYTESGGNPADETVFSGPDTCEAAWSQVALTFDAGAANVWVDGTPQFTQVAYTDIGWGAQPFAVANDPNNLTRHFVGDLDETQVYDVPLTAYELETLRLQAFCP